MVGFATLDGHLADGNPSTVKGRWLVNGKRGTLVVRVRADHVEAALDDRRLSAVQTDRCGDLAMPAVDRPNRPDVLGVQAWDSHYLIHAAEVVEVTGRGQPVADGEPDPTPTRTARLAYDSPTGSHGWLDLFADGATVGESGRHGLWFQHGSTVHLEWDLHVDTLKLSADHRSLAGRADRGGRTTGTVLSGSL